HGDRIAKKRGAPAPGLCYAPPLDQYASETSAIAIECQCSLALADFAAAISSRRNGRHDLGRVCPSKSWTSIGILRRIAAWASASDVLLAPPSDVGFEICVPSSSQSQTGQ